MKVVPVPVRDDNYAYLLIDEPSNKAAAVDPYDVDKVTAAAKEQGVQIVAAITTHHHYDHAGGNKAFAAKFPGVPIYGGSTLCDAADKIVKDKEEFKVGDSIDIRCLATPCHTQDSICYYVTDKKNKNQPGGVFTGDTLFIGGCGRFFEGTGGEMLRALSYLGTLPGETIVYNGHEYTSGNVAFGQKIDPENADIKRLATLAKENSVTTGLTTIADEKKWNVFMRLNSEAVRKATNTDENNRDEYVMETLRDQKNKFRGSLL